ncbi:MAG TPA: hypothetical protein VFR08_04880 [Candidatus Angelobacter sp.]|nr:hypothetical protein [Candidatus Angelobacter sp.]
MKLFRPFISGLMMLACAAAWGQVTSRQQPQLRTGFAAGTQQPAPNGQTKSPTKAVTSTRGVPTPAATPAPIASPTPMQPMSPADMPPVPPQVTFKNGLLTVNAVNSTLASLLTAIRNKTGIEFEGAELAGQDRVAISMGPATEGEVLASILSGSNLDYVVMGRPDSPTIVQRVLLTRRTRPGAATVANGQPPAANQPPQEGEEEAVDENATDPDQPQDTAVQAPPVQQQPAGQAQQPQQQPEAQPQQPDQQQQPKTPEQLLQELKEMQQKQTGQTPDPNSAPRKLPPR